MDTPEKKIIDLLTAKPNQKSYQIAAETDLTKEQVNKILYKNKAIFLRDSKNNWCMAYQINTPQNLKTPDLKTPLSTLCNYYLACLGCDDENGIHVFAKDKNGNCYTEISQVIGLDLKVALSSSTALSLVNKHKSNMSKKTLYLGYPCYLKHQQSEQWSGFFLEPIFYYPIELVGDEGKHYEILQTSPAVNFIAIQNILHTDKNNVYKEIVDLEKEIGMDSEESDLDDIVLSMFNAHKEWNWVDNIDPYNLNTSVKIQDITKEGIYNKAVIILADRSPFTAGLEYELHALANIPENKYADTALGKWINKTLKPYEPLEVPNVHDSEPLVEVLPTNGEQRESIHGALNDALTVITGPPGTGKSQVVTNMIVNAFWRDKKILLSSKNNKAVDVVESRVNNLGPRPILIRTGKNEYRRKIVDFISNYLAAHCSENDANELKEDKVKRDGLVVEICQLDKEEKLVITLRNRIDKLEQTLEKYRGEISPLRFRDLRLINLDEVALSVKCLGSLVNRADRSKQSLWTRIFWSTYKDGRFNKLKDEVPKHDKSLNKLNIVLPPDITDISVAKWQEGLKLAGLRVSACREVITYLNLITELQCMKTLPQIARNKESLHQKMAQNDNNLWNHYLKIQPNKLTNEGKQILTKLQNSLQTLIDSGDDFSATKKVHAELLKQLNQLRDIFPCWAVSSLSAKDKIPFEPGYFDIVVIDEASQCDIASALPLLYRAKNAVIIGDQMQLPHIAALPVQQDNKLLQQHNPDLKFRGWMYSCTSLFKLANSLADDGHSFYLRDHHRSHADIIEFSNKTFYGDNLRIATNYSLLKTDRLTEQGVKWVDVKGDVVRPSSGGALNRKESLEVVKQVKHIVSVLKYEGSIGIVTPFRAQANHIRDMINKDAELDAYNVKNDIIVDTVHKYQGDERDVMIFSPVVSNNMHETSLRFLMGSKEIFNVAITRARALLLVVGDKQACLGSGIDYLCAFAKYVKDLEEKQQEQVEIEVVKLGQEYPPVRDMSVVSEWEIVLYKALYEKGIRTIPQYSIDKYVLDFALIDGGRKLNIEVDGEQYHKDWNGELCWRDQIRNQRMFELGWDVMRFWVYEIRDDIDYVIRTIKAWQVQQ